MQAHHHFTHEAGGMAKVTVFGLSDGDMTWLRERASSRGESVSAFVLALIRTRCTVTAPPAMAIRGRGGKLRSLVEEHDRMLMDLDRRLSRLEEG